jgi:pSer/pThr/pTyr-binding forkhead associated (FHA) protein
LAWLEQLNGERHALTGSALTIGRDDSCDLCVGSDPKVSRSHASLELREDQWVLRDLDSRNGTWVNDRQVREHALREGDRVRVGATTLVYRIGVDPNATEGDRLAATQPFTLSAREGEILDLVAEGLTDRGIGERLSISTSTVRSHLDRIRDKTGLRRRSELTRLALSRDRTS